ncbi:MULTISPECIES: TonB-dependent receptor domain-containing protein [unclassified Duganella]|uniref:TonB-dependent receptor domain-containing protein n=1 Tax=unclassified Duganella TaxID=2636909 RepID=UPI000E34BB1E|nr:MULTISPECIES: TonB-dependent receptor [unclassified Duganella]RFP09514.1 TonB-dependent receptor [Duganella sp. BJB475]RFP27634.1 TonB-dependent receptor [Duganella sp. BJB476]
MSKTHNVLPKHFRAAPLAAAVVAALGLLSSGALHAAEPPTIAELQAEIARLKQALAAKEGAATSAAQPAPEAAPAPTVAAAEDEPQALGAVTVRAKRKIELLKDVPLSVSVVTGAELDRELAQDLSAITKRSAGIQFNQNNTRGASLSIRGLGKRSFTETQDPSVGMVVDGVSYGLSQLANFDFYDVDSVDVTRGPQGTLGGKGASSGVVSINTKRPSFYPSADYQITYGQRDTLMAKANLGGPIIDDLLAWRGSFLVDRSRGYYTNNFDSNYSLYNKNRVSGRTQFLFTPSADFNARISFDLEPHAPQVQNGLTFYKNQPDRFADGSLTDPSGTTTRAKLTGYTNASGAYTPGRAWFAGRDFNGSPYTYANNYIGDNNINFNENQGQTVHNKGGQIDLTWNLANHTLTSITATRKYSFDAHNDEGTPFDINRNGGGGVDYQQFSQELKLKSKPGGAFDYVTGLFYLKTKDDIASKTGWGSDAGAWFATTAQYNTLDRLAGVNRGAGLALLKDALDDALTKGDTMVDTKSSAIYGNGTWHATDAISLNGGLRLTHENRTTTDLKVLTANGAGAALNPVAVRGVQLGGFNSTASGALAAGNSTAQVALADAVASRYFGAASYGALSTAQLAQVAAAKALRAGQVGQLISGITSHYDDNLVTATLSPSYRFNDNVSGYTSWQYGEKSGSALNVNGLSANVRPEKTNAFEVGLKSSLLKNTLILNADLFQMNIRDYQSTVRVVDDFTTQTNIANGQANPTAYVTAQGNVPKVRARGLELDAVYSGIQNLSIRVAGAYTDARYVSFPLAAKPDELAYLAAPYVDQSGLTLPGVAKWTGNVGAEYRLPVWGDKQFHTSFTTAFTSRYNNTDTLSDYGYVPGNAVTDLSVGLTFKTGFDVSLVVKNATDNRAHEPAWTSYAPNPYPRWFGLTFSGKL